MVQVLNTRNSKKGKAERVDEDTWTVIFDDGEQKEVKNITFERWYTVLTGDEAAKTNDTAPESDPETPENPTDAETDQTSQDAPESDAEAEAKKKEAAEKAAAEKAKKAAERKAAKEAQVADRKKKEEARKAAKAEADAKKKAEKEAEVAKKKEAQDASKETKEAKAAAKAAEKAEKEAERARKKAEKEAAKANAPARLSKEAHKEFFTKFLAAVNEKEPQVTDAKARDRNYMSFPASASGFKFKFVKTGDKLSCSLYIFGPQVVTQALFNELEKHKDSVNQKLDGYEMDWSAPEDLKVRRVRTTFVGTDEELIEKGVEALIRFRSTFIPLIDMITK